ncbi:hypothetical protein P691DRAFT_810134 [Macrolepiota fuliginosa MF-IS2]|uniref:Uncharacterized protein n=1 Tax=Macrolepiota fuliginosa MF-IS2 TaxID=1400762 RepID=A0A9P5X2E6_9AGAR|nr:hypothetical protein P691DRAFT_810134 [Macrolepiota fuliginosa MF-IS2]
MASHFSGPSINGKIEPIARVFITPLYFDVGEYWSGLALQVYLCPGNAFIVEALAHLYALVQGEHFHALLFDAKVVHLGSPTMSSKTSIHSPANPQGTPTLVHTGPYILTPFCRLLCLASRDSTRHSNSVVEDAHLFFSWYTGCSRNCVMD